MAVRSAKAAWILGQCCIVSLLNCSGLAMASDMGNVADDEKYYLRSIYELLATSEKFNDANVVVRGVTSERSLSFIFPTSDDAFLGNMSAGIFLRDGPAFSAMVNHEAEVCRGRFFEIQGTFKWVPYGASGYVRELHDLRQITAIYRVESEEFTREHVCYEVE